MSTETIINCFTDPLAALGPAIAANVAVCALAVIVAGVAATIFAK